MKFFCYSVIVIFLACGCGDTTTYFLETENDTDSAFLAMFVLEDDAGADSSVDTDTDSDTDTDTDTDSDTDTDTDSDTGTTSDTGTEVIDPCPYECVSEEFCGSLGGTIYNDYDCSDSNVCCLVEVDTGSCPHTCISEPLCMLMDGEIHYGFDCGASDNVCCILP